MCDNPAMNFKVFWLVCKRALRRGIWSHLETQNLNPLQYIYVYTQVELSKWDWTWIIVRNVSINFNWQRDFRWLWLLLVAATASQKTRIIFVEFWEVENAYLEDEVEGRQRSDAGNAQAVCLARSNWHHVRSALGIRGVAAQAVRRARQNSSQFGTVVPSTPFNQQRLRQHSSHNAV